MTGRAAPFGLRCRAARQADRTGGQDMAGSGRKPPPLVAERRTAGVKVKAHKAVRKPSGKPKVSAKAKAPRGGNFLTRLIGAVFRLIARIMWWIGSRVALAVAIVLGGAVFYFHQTLPPLEDLLDARARGSVTFLDRQGAVFAWRGETFGGQITADHVSPYLKNAIIATEDKRFYQHFGVSPRGIASAIAINLRAGRGALQGNGGSTITQQVAKLLCLGVPYDPKSGQSEAAYEAECRKGSVWRKLKEVPYALAMETKYSKDDILTIYLNRAYLGAGARGFEAASQRYFGKSANVLLPAEGAMLAGLLIAPSRFAPTNNLARAQGRANVILGLMADQGYITPQQAAEGRTRPAQLSEAAEARAGGYFADWVMESAKDFLNATTAATKDVVIRTTFDRRIQTAAESALKDVFDARVKDGSKAQAAIVVMSSDGAVHAMVGGRKTQVSGAFNRATQAKRQTGSSFKPFVYAAALDLGYQPEDLVDDTPLTLDIPGSGPWSPRNYDGKFKGPITLTQALAESRNIPAVRVSETVGRDAVRTVAQSFGIGSALADGPALALGASESTLIEMTGAYAGILNGGTSVTPYGLVDLRIQADDMALVGQDGGLGERAISEPAARELIAMMTQVMAVGTGTRAALSERETAGKSGTTQAARDAWFIGFSAEYVTGVWMGYDDNSPLSGVTGGGLPAEIWHETMLRVHDGLPANPLPRIDAFTTSATIRAGLEPLSSSARPSVYDMGGRLNGTGSQSGSMIDRVLHDLFGFGRAQR